MKIQTLLSQLEQHLTNCLPWIRQPIPVFLSDVHENMTDSDHLVCALRELNRLLGTLKRESILTDDAKLWVGEIAEILAVATSAEYETELRTLSRLSGAEIISSPNRLTTIEVLTSLGTTGLISVLPLS